MRNPLTGIGIAALLLAAGCTLNVTDPGSAGEAPERRNVILFLGDGMGISTITAARILAGQRAGGPGEDHELSFDRFPHIALVKTYNIDAQVADSAGTMSAIVTGEKTRIGFVSVAGNVNHNDCAESLRYPLPTLLQRAADAGYATGMVSTTRITHATPAALYAHVPNRDWEADSNLPPRAVEEGCRDIARQLVESDHGHAIDVVLGGGRAQFLPETASDPEYPEQSGRRTDGRDLIEEWQQRGPARHFVWNDTQFRALDPDAPAQVLGLFEPSHMQFDADRERDAAGEPSLTEMTEFAIRRLAQGPRGFFLMVEGGRIDHGHHGGNAYRALTDTVAMADAVAAALALTDPAETLILVTADHSHTLTLSGYPRRGNPILGKVETPFGGPGLDSAGRPYTTLGYANGPGHQTPLRDLTEVDTEAHDFLQPATVPLSGETHGGEDVAAFAHGLNAEAVRGVMEQNRLFHVMRDALQLPQ